MNKISNIPNKIKQSPICCTYCGKGYKSRNAFEKHLILCEIISKSKNKKSTHDTNINEEEDIPSNRRMYWMLLELANKYNNLEQKMEEINKWVIKKKKKINVLDWLNANITPTYTFEDLSSKIIVTDMVIEFLLNNTFNDTLNELFSNNIYSKTEFNEDLEINTPLFAFVQKANTFYIYDKQPDNLINKWQELSKEKLTRVLNIIQMNISKAFLEWKKKHKEDLKENDHINSLCDKALVKIMAIEFKQEQTYAKTKSMMYNKMKTDMKALVEYEFEF